MKSAHDRRMIAATLAGIASLSAHPALSDDARESRPGVYRGYAEVRYDGVERVSQYVAVRDGARLAIDIFRPTANGEAAREKLPVLWMHTPYNRRLYRGGSTAEDYPGNALQLARYGYVVAVADFRGLYSSFGRNAGFNRGEWQDAAWWDAYDITEWLAKQPWSNGKVGMWGCSATGGSQMQALATAPPSLKAVFPMSCEWDVYGFVAPGGMTPGAGPTQIMRGGSREERDHAAVAVDEDPEGKLVAQAVAEHANNLETAGYTPFRDSVSEAFGNQWWLKSSPHTYRETIGKSGVAIYGAANWEEGATGYGPAFLFANVKNPRKVIFGPANHCDWSSVLKTTGFDIVIEELRFFDYWLKGVQNGVMSEPAVTYYTYNEAPDAAWKSSRVWPLATQQRTPFYLAKGALGAAAPASANDATQAQVDYSVDEATFWTKGVVFQTEPLARDTEITGHPELTLWLSSSARDADVVARVDVIGADGSRRYYGVEGKLRASLRKIAPAPYVNLGLPWHPFTEDSVEPLEPGKPVELRFDLYATSQLIRAGERLRLTLNFADPRTTPKLDPAPEVTVHHGATLKSVLVLPIIPR